MTGLPAFALVLVLAGAPGQPPRLVPTAGGADTLDACRALVPEAEALLPAARPHAAFCFPSTMLESLRGR